jgi:hypothetical protein
MKNDSQRPRLPAVSEQMQAWSTALAAEVSEWPRVSARSFFGFTALYRKDRIFALLPRTRGMASANALAFKLERPPPAVRAGLDKDPRLGSFQREESRWFSFELSSDADLHDALDWLGGV